MRKYLWVVSGLEQGLVPLLIGIPIPIPAGFFGLLNISAGNRKKSNLYSLFLRTAIWLFRIIYIKE